MLTPDEQKLVRRLAVFAGGFNLEGAVAVGVAAHPPTPDTRSRIPLIEAPLTSLVEQSLVGVDIAADGQPRFGMLETIRAYAREALEAAGEVDASQRRHAAYFIGLTRAIETAFHQGEPLDWLDHERDNIRAALRWCLAHDPDNGLRLAATWAATRVVARGFVAEPRRWLEDLLARSSVRSADRARALVTLAKMFGIIDRARSVELAQAALSLARETEAGRVAVDAIVVLLQSSYVPRSEPTARRALADEMVQTARSLSDPATLRQALYQRSRWAIVDEAYTLAERYLDEAQAIPETQPSPLDGEIVNLRGQLARIRGDYRRAIAETEQSIAILRGFGQVQHVVWSLNTLALIYLMAGELDRARAKLAEGLTLLRERDLFAAAAGALYGEGVRAILEGAFQRGARLLGRANRGEDPLPSMALFSDELALYRSVTTAARGALGEEAYRQAWTEGLAMTDEEAIAYALEVE